MPHKTIWIEAGYERFAQAGLAGLKVEALAKQVGVSKSSFYHHFADMELFVEQLLARHTQQAAVLAEKELQSRRIDPDLIGVLLEHKMDLLFSRQLRVHRNHKAFGEALAQSDQIIGHSFAPVWMRELNLKLSPKQLEGIFSLALENFFLQITADNLNYDWLSRYFAQLKRIASSFS
jgi:AcrR family transcriptional regulator